MNVTACRKCGQKVRLTLARRLSYNHICSPCANRLRDADAARYMTRKLAESMRRKGLSKPFPGVSFIRQVIAKCDGQSILSGRADLRHLCIALRHPDKGYTIENAVLLTSKECSSLSHRRRRQN